MVTGALAVVGVATGMNRVEFWGLAYLTLMLDVTIISLWL